jgi:hypothetical protein
MKSDYKKLKDYHEPLHPTEVSIYKKKKVAEGFDECNSAEKEYCSNYSKKCMVGVNNDSLCNIGTSSTYQKNMSKM